MPAPILRITAKAVRDPGHAAGGRHPLLARLQAFELDGGDASLPFTARLARANLWDIAFARRVGEEYKKFLFLACTVEHAVAPSEAVGDAWRLHLLHSQSYWRDLCLNVAKRPLHHAPTGAGETGRALDRACYARTLASYARSFGAPPADNWPNSERCFATARRRRTMALDAFWVVRKQPILPAANAALGAGLFGLAAWGFGTLFDALATGLLGLGGLGFCVAALTNSQAPAPAE